MRKAHWIVLTAAAWLGLASCSSPTAKPRAEQAPTKPDVAPDVFRVNLDTKDGAIVIQANCAWAPRGARQFYALVKTGFYDGNRFFRVVHNYVAQFGVSGDPETSRIWAGAIMPDDPVKQSNVRGTVTYAAAGPNSRTTQLFINLKDNKSLDKQGFAPIGKVILGMAVADRLYYLYGDTPPRGAGPDPRLIATRGNAYLDSNFPLLDAIRKATVQ
jgi:peptidyl-prolyl cis-trans isomerase A (cyclophilin A)